VVNSSIGLLGLVDVADKMDVKVAREDLGQTFASWGVKPGRYIMLPLLGPSNVRDSFGLIGESFSYYPIGEITDSSTGRIALTATNIIDFRTRLLGTESVLDAQVDPYSFLKVTYEQSRVKEIYDGNPPENVDQDLNF
jgi:phospholipid-binding lipoprotein MlaA